MMVFFRLDQVVFGLLSKDPFKSLGLGVPIYVFFKIKLGRVVSTIIQSRMMKDES